MPLFRPLKFDAILRGKGPIPLVRHKTYTHIHSIAYSYQPVIHTNKGDFFGQIIVGDKRPDKKILRERIRKAARNTAALSNKEYASGQPKPRLRIKSCGVVPFRNPRPRRGR